MDKILIDTSVFIDYQRAGVGSFITLLELSKNDKVRLYTCSVVLMEFWAGKSLDKENVRKFAEEMFYGIEVIDLDTNIAKRAGEMIRKSEISIGFDVVVAATSLEIGAQLATSNKKHFEKVPNLKLFEE
jgi:predicted nucleic acid-binding protein